MPRIEVEWIGLSRIDFSPFFIKLDTKIFSGWFGSRFRNASELLWYTRIEFHYSNSRQEFNPSGYEFGLIQTEFWIWINPRSSWRLGLKWNESDWVGLIFHPFSSSGIRNVCRIGSETHSGMPWNFQISKPFWTHPKTL